MSRTGYPPPHRRCDDLTRPVLEAHLHRIREVVARGPSPAGATPRMSRTQGAPSRRPTGSTRAARRRQRSSRKVKLIAGVIPVVLVAAGLSIVVATGGVGATLNTTRVRVSTTEDFLPVLRKVATRVQADTNNAISCTVYDVNTVPPAVAVSQIAGDGDDRPDAWVP